MVEALTIVLAVGVTRGWRSAGWGVAVAVGGLVVIVAGLGPALANLPIDSLRLVVGTVLLVFGLQWLRKAVLRAGGLKALHDEEAIYEAEVALLAGVIVHAPLTRVPENTLKFGVGVMLTAFGMFWSAEGAGITWPGADLALVGLIAFVVVLSFSLVARVRRAVPVPEVT